MKLGKLVTLSAAALLVSMGVAAAQGTGTTMSGGDANKCWDAASNQVKDKSSTLSGSSSNVGSSGATSGATGGTGDKPMGSGNTGSASTSGSSSTVRPSGMSNC